MLRLYRKIPLAMSAAAVAVATLFDPFLPNTGALVHAGNQSPYILDDAGSNLVPVNNAIVGTACAGSYLHVPHNPAKYLSVADSPDWTLGMDDFTIDLWIKPNNYLSTTIYGLLGHSNGGGNQAKWGLYLNCDAGGFYTPGVLTIAAFNGSTVGVSWPFVPNQTVWQHLAIQRSGSNFDLFVDGVKQTTVVANFNLPEIGTDLRIGADGEAWKAFNGFMHDVRLTKAARYSSNFTPRLKFATGVNDPYWNDVVLAIDADTMTDLKGHTVTNNGITKMIPGRFDNSVIYSTGSGVACQIPSNAKTSAFPAGTDFTVECWINMPTAPNASGMIVFDNVVNNGGLNLTVTSTNLQIGRSWIGVDHTFNTTWNANQWYHLAIVRSGTTLYCYKDGVLIGSAANNFSYNQGIIYIGVGGNGSSLPYTGFISDFRITKGIARANYGVSPQAFSVDGATTVLMKYEGTDGSVLIVDDAGHTVVRNGSAAISTAQAAVGSSSLYLNGASSVVLSDFPSYGNFGTSDFTIECWTYCTAASLAPDSYIISIGGSSGNGGHFGINLYNNTWRIGGFSNYLITAPAVNVLNRWNHVAMVRSGNTLTAYVNGISIGSVSVAGANFTPSTNLVIGNYFNYGAYSAPFTGYIDGLRISTTARYTTTFGTSYPVPTNRLADYRDQDYYWDSTVLLLNMDGTDGSANFVEERGNLVTPFGAAALTGAQKKYSNTSMAFNGTNAYATIPYHPDFNLGKSDFTIEWWGRTTETSSAGSGRCVASQAASSAAGNSAWFVGLGTDSCLYLSNGSGWQYVVTSSGVVVNDGLWHHFAAVRYGDTIYIYVDGIARGSTSLSAGYTVGASTRDLFIGSLNGGGLFNGNIAGLRITKAARYKSRFSVPVDLFYAPVQTTGDRAWHRTLLSMDFEGAQGSSNFIDRTGLPITKVGTPAISTTQSKFGSGALLCGAAGNYLTVPGGSKWDFSAASTDFTIEMWAYLPSGYGFTTLIGQSMATGDGNWFAYIYANGRIALGRAGINELPSAVGVFQADQWNHVAFVKRAGTYYIYYNGGLVATGTTGVMNSSSNPLCIGAPSALNVSASGNAYIEDLRISNMARYVGAFTPPSSLPVGVVSGPELFWLYNTLLLDFEGEHGSTAITDVMGNAVTRNGNPIISTAQARTGSASLYLNGSSALTLPNVPTLNNFGTEDFTIEAWVYTTDNSAERIIAGCYSAWPTAVAWLLEIRAGGDLRFYAGDGASFSLQSGAGAVPNNTWVHVAVCRVSGSTRLFANGVMVATSNTAVTINNTSSPRIGADPTTMGTPWLGYIDDFRITKGVGRYKGAFIPPVQKLATASSF